MDYQKEINEHANRITKKLQTYEGMKNINFNIVNRGKEHPSVPCLEFSLSSRDLKKSERQTFAGYKYFTRRLRDKFENVQIDYEIPATQIPGENKRGILCIISNDVPDKPEYLVNILKEFEGLLDSFGSYASAYRTIKDGSKTKNLQGSL